MKLFSTTLELQTLKSICDSKDAEAKSLLLASTNPDWFHYAPAKAAYERVRTVARKHSSILSYSELCDDPALSEEFRGILSEVSTKPVRSKHEATKLLKRLGDRKLLRDSYEMAKYVIETLKGDSVEVDKLVEYISVTSSSLQTGEALDDIIHTVGYEANAVDAVEDALSMEDEPTWKTGFDEIDIKNGGVFSEGVFIIAATTSGGKSAVLMNLLMNLYKLNKISVANISLEMNKNKNVRRMLSRMTRIPFWKFVKKQLSAEERAQARSAWKKFHRFGEKNKCKFTMVCPKRGITSDSAFALVRPFGYQVVGLDYAGLLEGVDDENQWRKLSAVVRQAKIFSGENKCLVIILAQLDSETENIRYSRGMLEHADGAWKWAYVKPEVRENHVLPISQIKWRDGELFGFELKEMFETMTVDNMDSSESNQENSGKKGAMSGVVTSGAGDEEITLDFDAGHT